MIEKSDVDHLDCTLSDTDIFTPAFVQKDIQHGFFEEIFPISKLSDSGPVEFFLENATDKFLDLANSYVKFKLRIKKTDGGDLGDGDIVAPINYILGTMFGQVDVKLNGTTISTSNNTYAYQAYLETLLNYGIDAKKSQLQMGLFFKDPAGKHENVKEDENSAFKTKASYFKKSAIAEVCGQLHSSIFNQGRLLLNGISLKITCHRNKSTFVFMSGVENGDYKLEITEAVFCARRVQLTPHKFIEVQKNLEHSLAKYPINRVDVRTHSVAAGLTSFIRDNVTNGQLPNRVFIRIVDNDAYNGRHSKN